MKKYIISSAILFVVVFSSYAQDKSSDLQTLIDLMQQEKMIDQMMSNMSSIMKQQAQSQITGDEAEQKMDSYIQFMTEELKTLTKRLVNEDLPGIYDKYFSHEEIKDLIAFYESSTGQKMLEKTPKISKDLLEIMMKKYIPAFQQKLMEKMQSLK
ncbi:MAG: hypothetical protein CNE98_05515 [Bacteroidetes bacterium MED-G17]|nr:MAG: hypothetical protein CBB99_07140 [Bacteroidetes bacterium TMED39]PDH52201.1 MAG: hypothetical protein CNE98_05515 [Bacteroidetes bacterium MED-G17]CAI8301075.1 MAG: Uncharacterised protein [Bacteroidetes bacterium MED-G17]|tara:strand:- start:6909 stop:7373 length:465 start_codon:yes stop_codon:yes gene_type:complete